MTGEQTTAAVDRGTAAILDTVTDLVSGPELWALLLIAAGSMLWAWAIMGVIRDGFWPPPPRGKRRPQRERWIIRLVVACLAVVPFVVIGPLVLVLAFDWPWYVVLPVVLIVAPGIGAATPVCYDVWWGWIIPTAVRLASRKMTVYHRQPDGTIVELDPNATTLGIGNSAPPPTSVEDLEDLPDDGRTIPLARHRDRDPRQ